MLRGADCSRSSFVLAREEVVKTGALFCGVVFVRGLCPWNASAVKACGMGLCGTCIVPGLLDGKEKLCFHGFNCDLACMAAGPSFAPALYPAAQGAWHMAPKPSPRRSSASARSTLCSAAMGSGQKMSLWTLLSMTQAYCPPWTARTSPQTAPLARSSALWRLSQQQLAPWPVVA